jgi:chemotaxis protein methyltransferase CheR
MRSYHDYYERLVESEEERVILLDCISTNETHFFREPQHFQFLERQVFPLWEQRANRGEMQRKIRVWSAACSTGEEPYSLAMTLLHRFPASNGWSIEIVASDISTRVLDKARAGLWPVQKASEIPKHYLKLYMQRGVGTQQGWMRAGDLIRSVVKITRVNLNLDRYPVVGRFDLVFCRNVLIYFDGDSKRGVIDRLTEYLTPGGYFFVGHAETLNGVSTALRSVMPTVYRLDAKAPHPVERTADAPQEDPAGR